MPKTAKKQEPGKEQKKVRKLKDESSFAFFVHATMFLFFLSSSTFLMFLYKNRYPLFVNNEILPEVLYGFVGLLVVSVVSFFFFSFIKFLGRLFLATAAGACAAYLLGLCFPNNVGHEIGAYISFIPSDLMSLLTENGNMYVGCVVGLMFYLLLNMFKGGAMAVLTIPMMGIVFFLLNNSSKQLPVEVQKKPAFAVENLEEQKKDNLIYLILSDHTSYRGSFEQFQSLDKENPLRKDLSPAFMNDFYQSNGFTFYTTAFTKYTDRYRSVGGALNPEMDDVKLDLFNRDDASYFISSDEAKAYPTTSSLFKKWQDDGYKINVYQTYPLDFCKTSPSADICISHPGPLGALYKTNISPSNRFFLLLGHFLRSFPAGKKVVKMAKEKFPKAKVPFIAAPYSASLPIGQADVLYRLNQDVQQAEGKNVFFAHLSLPLTPYMYDENCQLEDNPMKWRNHLSENGVNEFEKNKVSYMKQLACTYGQINYLIEDLKKKDVLKNTKIIIHGDRGENIKIQENKITDYSRIQLMKENIRLKNLTVFAVYDPAVKKASVRDDFCDVPTLVSRYALGNKDAKCRGFDFESTASESEQRDINNWLGSSMLAEAKKAGDYKKTYTTWLENGGQLLMAKLEQLDRNVGGSVKVNFMAPPSPSVDEKVKEEQKTDQVPVPEVVDENPPFDVNALSSEEKAEVTSEVKEETAKLENSPAEKLPDLEMPALPPVVEISPVAELPEVKSVEIEKVVVEEKVQQPVVEQKTAEVVVEEVELPPVVEVVELPKEMGKETVQQIKQTKTTVKVVKTVEPQTAKPADTEIKVEEKILVEEAESKPKQIDVPQIKSEYRQDKWKTIDNADSNAVPVVSELQQDLEENTKVVVSVEEKVIEKTDDGKTVEETLAEANQSEVIKAEEKQNVPVTENVAVTTTTTVVEKTETVPVAGETLDQKIEQVKQEEVKTETKKTVVVQQVAEPKAVDQKSQSQVRTDKAKIVSEKREQEKKRVAEKRKELFKDSNQKDVTREVITERVNENGQLETFIFIERKPNPKRNIQQVAPSVQKDLTDELKHESEQHELNSTLEKEVVPVEETKPSAERNKTVEQKQVEQPVQQDQKPVASEKNSDIMAPEIAEPRKELSEEGKKMVEQLAIEALQQQEE
ncbi:MAG: hypothetical protein MJ250_01750 [Alphaproteobacteria bacterium]|nr:hypothetical protein [Alphaproteobacteria bacterium]